MSAIIYETINTYNRDRGICPYRYIGSDQHSKPSYLGSNKQLCEDIKRLGKQHFSKGVLCEFKNDIPNTLLRKIESYIQIYYNVAKDPTYYNKTNSSHKGYAETEEERLLRVGKLVKGRKDWWSSLTEEERQQSRRVSANNLKAYNAKMKGKSYEEIYGTAKAAIKKQKHSGKNNGMAKEVYHVESGKLFESVVEAMKFFDIKYYSVFHNKVKKGVFRL